MTKTIPGPLQTHLDLETTNLATLWRIERTDGEIFYFTDHDKDITFEGNVYESSVGYDRTAISNKVGLSVDELNVKGFLDSSAITEAELRAGRYDFAQVYVSLINWSSPSDGEVQMRRGRLGEVTFNDSGFFEAELRGLTQAYSQNIVELYQSECRADLGDDRCGVTLFPAVVRANTAYALEDTVRGSPLLDGETNPEFLAHFETSADDESTNAATATLGSQAALSAVEFNIGAGSIEFSPSGAVDPSLSFVSYPDISAYSLGTSEFTIECFVRFKDLTSSTQVFMSHYLNTGNERAWYIARNGANMDFFLSDDGTSTAPAFTMSGAVTWAINTWYHIAVTRDSSNDVRMFVDGVQVGSTTPAAFTVHNSSEVLRLGKFRSAGFDDRALDGFIDEARIVVGAAVYTGPFTPPATAFTTPTAIIAALTPSDFEDVYYEVTVAGTTGATFPNFDPTPGNTTVWGGVTFTAVEAFVRAATVATVTDDRTFTITFDVAADSREVDDWFKYGAVVWATGDNVDLTMEVKSFTATTDTVTLFLEMPFTIQVGDTLQIYAGCDKQLTTCINKFSNVDNFRGEPYVPGQGELLATPGA